MCGGGGVAGVFCFVLLVILVGQLVGLDRASLCSPAGFEAVIFMP